MMRVVHASQRFDRGAAALAADLAEHRAWADLIGLTEVHADRRHVLHADGWGHHAVGNCALTWPARDVASVRRERVVWEGSYRTKHGRHVTRADFPVVLITYRDGYKLVAAAAHLPPSVEAGWETEKRARVHRRQVRALVKAANTLGRTHGADGRVILADFNLNARRPWVRAWYAARFPRWRVVAPKRGTYKRHVLDYALVRGLAVVGVRRLPLTPASDHRAVRFRLRRRGHRGTAGVVRQQDVPLGGLGTGVAEDLAHSE